MKNATGFPQLFLRLALGLGFIFPVMDRIGWLGAAGSGKATWGDWQHFIEYTNTLLSFLNHTMANIAGLLATVAEVTFGLFLIVGFKIKFTARGGALLTLFFAFCMAIFLGHWLLLNTRFLSLQVQDCCYHTSNHTGGAWMD